MAAGATAVGVGGEVMVEARPRHDLLLESCERLGEHDDKVQQQMIPLVTSCQARRIVSNKRNMHQLALQSHSSPICLLFQSQGIIHNSAQKEVTGGFKSCEPFSPRSVDG